MSIWRGPYRSLWVCASLGLSAQAEAAHTCVADADGQVRCWGANDAGQLGYGDTTPRGGEGQPLVDLRPLELPFAARRLSVGGDHTCALDQRGRAWCWGRNDHGQLGRGAPGDVGTSPDQMGDGLRAVELESEIAAISAGRYHTCALTTDGAVMCWGGNGAGQLGVGDEQDRGLDPDHMGPGLASVDLGPDARAVAIAAGAEHTCALTDRGAVRCWGANGYGQLGLGDIADRGDGPGEMGAQLPAVALPQAMGGLVAGDQHTCALSVDSALYCWGRGRFGQLGLGDTAHRGNARDEMGALLPAVALGDPVVGLSAGGQHTCALTSAGALVCFGNNDLGQLGYGDTTPRGDEGLPLDPVALGGARATQLAAFGQHTCALIDGRALKCWGDNLSGQLGYGDLERRGDEGGEMGEGLPVVPLPNGSAHALPDQPIITCADSDGDAICDALDACPLDRTNDGDSDGVCQDVDNCPNVANPDQADNNGDGLGDACVSPAAQIHPTAQIGEGAIIEAGAVIDAYAQIGAGARVAGHVGGQAVIGDGAQVEGGAEIGVSAQVGAGASVGGGARIGAQAEIGAGALIGASAQIGQRSGIGAGAQIAGGVAVGDLSQIGADTQISGGCTVGDNVRLGDGAALSAGSHILSGAEIGARLRLGVGAVVDQHARLGDDVQIGAGVIVGDYAALGDWVTLGDAVILASGVEIGSFTQIGAGAEIRGSVGTEVIIGPGVFTGAQSVIGDGAVIEAGVTVAVFAAVGALCQIGEDAALYDGVTLGELCAIGPRSVILFRTQIGPESTVGADALIDEQVRVGAGFVMGDYSRLWPDCAIGDGVSIGAEVLIRDEVTLADGVVIEDGVVIYPASEIGEGTRIARGVQIGAADCGDGVCGQVSVGGCLEIGADVPPGASIEGICDGL